VVKQKKVDVVEQVKGVDEEQREIVTAAT